MQLDNLYQKFWVGTLLLVIIITGICCWLIRLIHRKYEQEMELKISGLNEEVNSLGMLWIYGRNQLKIDTKPKCSEPIIISKNKVSEFKKWINK